MWAYQLQNHFLSNWSLPQQLITSSRTCHYLSNANPPQACLPVLPPTQHTHPCSTTHTWNTLHVPLNNMFTTKAAGVVSSDMTMWQGQDSVTLLNQHNRTFTCRHDWVHTTMYAAPPTGRESRTPLQDSIRWHTCTVSVFSPENSLRRVHWVS